MKEVVLISLLALLPSCQWIISHPMEDAMAIEAVEGVVNQIYQSETGHPLVPAQISTPTQQEIH